MKLEHIALSVSDHQEVEKFYINILGMKRIKNTIARFLPYWHEAIEPAILARQKVLIVAHGNSLRAFIKYLDNLSDEEILRLNIPTGIPLVYDFDENFKVKTKKFLGDEKAIHKAMGIVQNQGKIKTK